MANQFLDLARQGRTNWWRYALTLLIVLFFYQIIGVIPVVALGMFLSLDQDPATQLNPETLRFEGIGPLLPYLAFNFILIALLIGLWMGMFLLHKRPLKSLVTPAPQVNWSRLFHGFWLYGLLLVVTSGAGLLLSPENYQFTLNPAQFLIFLPIALVVTPIQTSAEELFFRGYLMQGLGLLSAHPFIPMLGSSVLFMLPHLLNPEAREQVLPMALLYLFLGLFLAFITIKDNSLELALGVHAANNLFVVLILNYRSSALPSPSIFTALHLHPWSSLMSFAILASVFCLVVFNPRFPKRRGEP